jgi:hypothetical protein
MLTPLPPSVSRWSRKCGSLYVPPGPVTGIDLLLPYEKTKSDSAVGSVRMKFKDTNW